MENYHVNLNPKIKDWEVPDLRESVGWERRDSDYPLLFEKCTFWVGVHEKGKLIAFGYIAGTGLEHGYLEDIMVHPGYQRKGIGSALVKILLEEAKRIGIKIVTVTFKASHSNFYSRCGFMPSSAGLWRNEVN
ncbi:GNAT family acetyltransferase [Calothrix sp. PCC 7716]|nr:GNAT family acetyltransferase [Calothrix sp. PCC 7716]